MKNLFPTNAVIPQAPPGKEFSGFKPHWTLTYSVPPIAIKRDQPQIAKAANLAAIESWHEVILPGHFTNEAKSRYGYQKRTAYTEIKKSTEVGHRRPIEKSGLAKGVLGANVRFSATSHSARLVMRGPWYLSYRRKRMDGQLSPDLPAEIVSIADRDIEHLQAVATLVYQKHYNALMASRSPKTIILGGP